MKLKEKIKNKINTFKANTSRFQVLSLDEWLNANGLQENAQNRASYTQYRLDIDEKNKQQDKNLSRFIGSALFLVVFLVIFSIMCANSIGATGVISNNDISDNTYYNNTIDVQSITIPYDYSDGSYDLQYFYFYMGDLNADFFIIDNQVNFYYDILPLYNEIGSNLNDAEIVNYWQSKYPTVDFGSINWLMTNYYTYLTDIFYGVRSDFSVISSNSYTNGYNDGYEIGETDGYNDGYEIGKDDGYNQGYLKGTAEGETLKKGIFAIFDAPLQTLHSLLNFEVLGINFYSIFTFILTLALLGILTKTILGFFV